MSCQIGGPPAIHRGHGVLQVMLDCKLWGTYLTITSVFFQEGRIILLHDSRILFFTLFNQSNPNWHHHRQQQDINRALLQGLLIYSFGLCSSTYVNLKCTVLCLAASLRDFRILRLCVPRENGYSVSFLLRSEILIIRLGSSHLSLLLLLLLLLVWCRLQRASCLLYLCVNMGTIRGGSHVVLVHRIRVNPLWHNPPYLQWHPFASCPFFKASGNLTTSFAICRSCHYKWYHCKTCLSERRVTCFCHMATICFTETSNLREFRLFRHSHDAPSVFRFSSNILLIDVNRSPLSSRPSRIFARGRIREREGNKGKPDWNQHDTMLERRGQGCP